ncbi:coiled-coil domain-containing protein 178 isoform X2 [Lingula anatina]|uniref:Coiled-coil domain-containing protein 178 isoform X2 n=1 Tax=Lingula anatina TaxID=7574 RepID=A0A1S3KDD2_LINAN|nr:coiled-coil domain-containing protein 178 isoform X2 [Lingula anatina]|eukprot:XP_013420633.1 coiled-coil domain-containing protein 178 isoform X2 [Lingula anatina]
MASPREKVVRIDETSQHSSSTPARRALTTAGTTVLSSGKYSQFRYTSSIPQSPDINTDSDVDTAADDSGIDGEFQDEDLSEAGDVLRPLPEGWPSIPQIFRRRSCELTNAALPCVKKAVAHLELLQTSIEEWCRDTGTRASTEIPGSRASQASSSTGSLTSELLAQQKKGTPKKQLRFASRMSSGRSETAADRRTTSSISRATSSADTLSVRGVGVNDDRPDIMPQGLQADIPYLGAEEVVDEVMTLIARLEKDRIDTEDMLKKEKERVRTLNHKIDMLAEKRSVDLPAAVQGEHEACSMDISELAWHVAYKERLEERIQHKVGVAEVMNKRLKEDIAFVQKHCPLVEEKLSLERNAMAKIKEAQDDTVDELQVTIDRKQSCEAKSAEAFSKAEKERMHIKSDLDGVRTDLNHVSEDLAEAKMNNNTYIHQMNDCRQQLHDNDQEMIVLNVKNENSRAAEEIQARKVKDLEGRIREQTFEHKKLEENNDRLTAWKESKQAKFTEQISELENQRELKEETLKQLLRKNDERDMMIADMTQKIHQCQKQKVIDEKNTVRIHKEIARTEKQIEVTMEELSKVQTINRAIRDTLMSEENKASLEEEKLRITAESLKKQVKDEIHTKTVMQARIVSDNTELVSSHDEFKAKREKVQKVVDELMENLRVILGKVEKLRAEYAKRAKAIEGLDKELNQVQTMHQELETKLMGRKNVLDPQNNELKASNNELDNKIEKANKRTEMILSKLEDIDKSNNMMKRVWQKTELAIKQANEKAEELDIKLAYAQKVDQETKESLLRTTTRMNTLDMQHEQLMKDRREVHEKTMTDLTDKLILNKELASRYRQLQLLYVKVKNEYMNEYDGRVNMESTIKDLKQLHSLQVRMHAALQEYYKCRGAYNEYELNRMESETADNAHKVSELQGQLDGALSKIGQFLKTHLDGDAARRMAMEVLRREDAGLAREKTEVLLETATNGTAVAAH